MEQQFPESQEQESGIQRNTDMEREGGYLGQNGHSAGELWLDPSRDFEGACLIMIDVPAFAQSVPTSLKCFSLFPLHRLWPGKKSV